MEKVTLFFVSILILAITGVIFINPKGIESTQAGVEPIFEFKHYAFYNIGPSGVEEYLVSDVGYHYDERDVILDITYYKRSQNGIDELKSEEATVYPGYTDFNGSVTYRQRGGYKLISKDVRYNDKDKLITGFNPFRVTSERGEFTGNSFEIDMKERVLRAKEIRSTYQYE